MNFKVENWPFMSIYNTLAVEIESEAESLTETETKCSLGAQSETDMSGNLIWLKTTLNAVNLYRTFLPLSLLFSLSSLFFSPLTL